MIESSKVFARIVAAGDGSVYVILKNFQCCLFTSSCLFSLLKNPLRFIKKDAKKYGSPTGYPGPMMSNIMEIPGLTLAYLTNERRFVCEHPEILSLGLQNAMSNRENEHINLKKIFDEDSILDQKQWYLDVFLALGTKANKKVQNHTFELSHQYQVYFLTEMLQSRVFNKQASHITHFPDEVAPQENLPEVTSNAVPPQAQICNEDSDLPFLLCNLPIPAKSSVQEELKAEWEFPAHYIKLKEYTALHCVSDMTVYKWIKEGSVHYAKTAAGHYLLDKHDTPETVRRRRKETSNNQKKKNKRYNKTASNTYQEVQRYIQENNFFTENVRPYIRSYEETRYYVDNNYREVCWFGNSALILQVDLDYYSDKYKKTNRELILAGRSPVVPSAPDTVYDLHHIGQKKDSPLAIIPGNIHNSSKYYSVFHLSSNTSENLHTTSFDLQRQKFWIVYVQMCDQYKGYLNIPYLNSPKRN